LPAESRLSLTDHPPEILYVTGADRHLFGPTCALLASFQHRLPDQKLWVADFGFTPEQRNLFFSLGVLLEIPDAVRKQIPPDAPIDQPGLALAWYSKASLLEYVRAFTFDAMFWIDADIIVTGDLESAAEPLVAHMQAEDKIFAAAPGSSNVSLGKFLQNQLERDPNCNIAPFAANLMNLGVAMNHPYLNSGVFIATNIDALARWRYLTCTTAPHYLFEQNAFNVIAWLEPEKVELLDYQRWNLNNLALGSAQVVIENLKPIVHSDEIESLLVHATSARAEDYYWSNFSTDCGAGSFTVNMKFLGNPLLRLLQEFYLQQFAFSAQEEITAAGLATKRAVA
jgi:hypothetical protein